MSRDEASVEAEIQSKGLTAPRLTPDKIDAQIVDVAFHVFPGTTLTVCAMTLKNGFIVTGESASASPENFDAELGQKIARENARNKLYHGSDIQQGIYEFAGWLTTRDERILASATDDAAPMAQAVGEFLDKRPNFTR